MLVHWLKMMTFSWVPTLEGPGEGLREGPPSTAASRMSDWLRPPKALLLRLMLLLPLPGGLL